MWDASQTCAQERDRLTAPGLSARALRGPWWVIEVWRHRIFKFYNQSCPSFPLILQPLMSTISYRACLGLRMEVQFTNDPTGILVLKMTWATVATHDDIVSKMFWHIGIYLNPQGNADGPPITANLYWGLLENSQAISCLEAWSFESFGGNLHFLFHFGQIQYRCSLAW